MTQNETIELLGYQLDKLKKDYFFVTKKNHFLEKDLQNALQEIGNLEVEYKRLTKILARLDRGRV